MISGTQTLQGETRDAIVVGGGLVGAAIAYGLQRQGLSTLMLDEGDIAHRASRGNFGLIWVQSKGLGAPHYQHWTHGSAQAWPGRSRSPGCSGACGCAAAVAGRDPGPGPLAPLADGCPLRR